MEPSPWRWDFAPHEALVVVLASAVYLLAVRRFGASRGNVLAFAGSQLLLLALFVTPVDTLALEYLLSAHLVQNVVLAEWAPLLAVLGISAPVAARIADVPGVRMLTRPAVALPLWLVNYTFWHVPAVYDGALRNPPLLHVEHAAYVATGLALWWPVFHDEPHAPSSGARALYVFAAFLLASPIGLLLALVPSPVYEFYEQAPRLWNLSPLEDQQLAGVIMAGSEAIVFFAVFAVFTLRFFSEETAAA